MRRRGKPGRGKDVSHVLLRFRVADYVATGGDFSKTFWIATNR